MRGRCSLETENCCLAAPGGRDTEQDISLAQPTVAGSGQAAGTQVSSWLRKKINTEVPWEGTAGSGRLATTLLGSCSQHTRSLRGQQALEAGPSKSHHPRLAGRESPAGWLASAQLCNPGGGSPTPLG